MKPLASSRSVTNCLGVRVPRLSVAQFDRQRQAGQAGSLSLRSFSATVRLACWRCYCGPPGAPRQPSVLLADLVGQAVGRNGLKFPAQNGKYTHPWLGHQLCAWRPIIPLIWAQAGASSELETSGRTPGSPGKRLVFEGQAVSGRQSGQSLPVILCRVWGGNGGLLLHREQA